MPMKHGGNKKTPTVVSPPLLPFTRFSPGLIVVLQEIIYQSFFALVRLLQTNNAFSKRNKFFLSCYCWCVVTFLFCVYVFFHSSAIIELRIASYLDKSIASYLASHQIIR